MPRIAIMQGRLLPLQDGRYQAFPRQRWREEFALAAQAGLDAIEWIYDLQGVDANPIATEDGVAEMRDLARRYAVEVVSLCAHYFIDRPFVTAGPAEFAELAAVLRWLVDRCRAAGISRIALPFLDNARIETPPQRARILAMLRGELPHARSSGVEIHLETSLAPEELAALLAELPDPALKVNYDTGNSASLGYDVRRELAAYGPRIGSVHIKDRVCRGGTVPLGEGDVEFPVVFSGLAAIDYGGDYVFEVARAREGDEVGSARRNRAFLLRGLEQARRTVPGDLP